ncbi:aminoglycoside phosphotransferase family protein [Candidatus Thorarchaeota archaeon]|nr:MAG: aminoglycoside phosphotransferase family protein [Candidatus Thorarchaeota archaeon]
MSEELHGVHGLSLGELTRQLTFKVPSLGDLSIHRSPIGGWTNVNLLAESNSKKYVVKLPQLRVPYLENPYESQFRTYEHFSQLGICPEPIAFGRLDTEIETPFLVLRFVEGEIIPNLSEMSSRQLDMIREVMATFASSSPQGLPRHESSLDYSHHLLGKLENTLDQYNAPSSLVSDSVKTLRSITDSLLALGAFDDTWPKDVMHGDLQEPNIVFTESEVMFIDLEETSIGESLYDIAYLVVQNPKHGPTRKIPSQLARDDEPRIRQLMPLALLSVIAWTLDRIVRTEAGVLEESLGRPTTSEVLRSYLNSKMLHYEELSSRIGRH